MKHINSNQEILLNSNSSFFKREYAERITNNQQKKLSQKEKIAELCWNGLLPDILPEISETDYNKKPLTIWEINATQHIVDLRLGEFNENLNDEYSVNPYVYLTLIEYN